MWRRQRRFDRALVEAEHREPLARHIQPVVQVAVLGQDFLHLGVGLVDVLRVAGQSAPAERADAAAEQRADIGRNEARKRKGVFQTFIQSHLPDVVAVIQRRHARVPEIDHRGDMNLHACPCRFLR